MAHYTLDTHRLMCPMPVIRTQDRVAELQAGDTLEVFCSDPGALNDIPAWCRINGHEVIEIKEQKDEVIITVRVGEQD